MACLTKRTSRGALLAALCLSLILALAMPARAELAQSGPDQVFYEVQGQGDPTIVLVHGFCCDNSVWAANLAGLAKKHKVVLVELPGHGRSSRVEGPCGIARLAKGVAAAVQAAGVKKGVLIGHSLGGTVARQVAVDRPDLVGGLVMDDAALDWVPAEEAARSQWAAQWAGLIAGMKKDFPATMQGFVRPMLGPVLSPAQKAAILTLMGGCNQAMAVSIMEDMARPQTWDMAPVPQPTLAICAVNPYLPKDMESKLKGRFPNLTYRLWDGVGHFLMMDRPQEFNREVLTWMDSSKF